MKVLEKETSIVFRQEQDGPWKQALDHFLQPFMEFHFPEHAAKIDWSQGYTPMEQELLKLAPDSEIGKGIVDKLYRVRLKDGQIKYVFLHLEVQGQKDGKLSFRVAMYYQRLFLKFGPNIFTVVILIDANKNWHPKLFTHEFWGCGFTLHFETIKLLNLMNRLQELEESNNPFAAIMYVHLMAMKSKKSNRLVVKTQIARRLLKKGFDKKTIYQLFDFIDYLMRLPPELEREYYLDISAYEQEEETMRYIPSYVKDLVPEYLKTEAVQEGIAKGLQEGIAQGLQEGIEKGLQEGITKGLQEGIEKGLQEGIAQGLQEGKAQTLLQLLNRKFGEIPQSVHEELKSANDEKIFTWTDKILTAQTLSEMFE